MSTEDAVEAFTSVALVLVAVFQIRQWIKTPRDPALRVLAPSVVLLALNLGTAVPIWPLTVIREIKIDLQLDNTLWMSIFCSYSAFFLMADHHRPIRQRRRGLVLHLVIFALVTAVSDIALFTRSGPITGTGAPLSWRYFVFNGVFDAVCIAFWITGTWLAVRYARRLTHRLLRAAVSLVIIGTGAMTIGVDWISLLRYMVLYLITPGGRYPITSDVYNIGRLGGQFLLALGLALVPLAASAIRVREIREQRQRRQLAEELEPLRQRLAGEFPYLVLPTSDPRPDFARTITEITDGLSRAAAYIPEHAPLAHHHEGSAAVASLADRGAAQAADLVAAALRARADAGPDPERAHRDPPYVQLEPNFGTDWRARARWMCDLSEGLRQSGLLSPSPSASATTAPPPAPAP